MDAGSILHVLLSASDTLSNSWSLDEGFAALARAAAQAVAAGEVALTAFDADRSALRIVAAAGLSPDFIRDHRILADAPIIQSLLVGRRHVRLDTVSATDATVAALRLEAVCRSLLAVPIVAMHRPVGAVIATSGEPSHFTSEHEMILCLIAGMAGGYHDRCALYGDRRRLMAVDPDTGLWAFEFFSERLDEEITRAGRHATPLGLLMLDLDNFLRFKDTYGDSPAADVFAAFIDAVRGAVRGIDLLGRFGLNEILVAMPHTDLAGATAAAHRALAAISRIRHPAAHMQITASAGLALYQGPDDSAGRMVSRAQKALYAAKLKGAGALSAPD